MPNDSLDPNATAAAPLTGKRAQVSITIQVEGDPKGGHFNACVVDTSLIADAETLVDKLLRPMAVVLLDHMTKDSQKTERRVLLPSELRH